MHGWMDGWMCMHGWMDGWMDVHAWLDGWMDEMIFDVISLLKAIFGKLILQRFAFVCCFRVLGLGC